MPAFSWWPIIFSFTLSLILLLLRCHYFDAFDILMAIRYCYWYITLPLIDILATVIIIIVITVIDVTIAMADYFIFNRLHALFFAGFRYTYFIFITPHYIIRFLFIFFAITFFFSLLAINITISLIAFNSFRFSLLVALILHYMLEGIHSYIRMIAINISPYPCWLLFAIIAAITILLPSSFRHTHWYFHYGIDAALLPDIFAFDAARWYAIFNTLFINTPLLLSSLLLRHYLIQLLIFH